MAGSSIRIIQINLAKSFKGTQHLSNFLVDNQQDITFIQEPYAPNNTVIGFAIKHKILAGNCNPKCAIVVHNDQIGVFPLVLMQNIVAVKV